MGRAFVFVILRGGVVAGYIAHEFSRKGISPGQLCIISEESQLHWLRHALWTLHLTRAQLHWLHLLLEGTENIHRISDVVGAEKDKRRDKMSAMAMSLGTELVIFIGYHEIEGFLLVYILEEKAGYFFCVQDRTLLCRNCDVIIHQKNQLGTSHKIFIVTGVRVGLQHYVTTDTNSSSTTT